MADCMGNMGNVCTCHSQVNQGQILKWIPLNPFEILHSVLAENCACSDAHGVNPMFGKTTWREFENVVSK